MSFSTIITWINLSGAAVAAHALFNVYRRYVIAKRMQIYLFMTIAAMTVLMLTQVILLVREEIDLDWRIKLATVIWWLKKLYFAYAIRFSSLKK